MTCRVYDYRTLLKNSLRKWDLRKWAVFAVLLLMLISLHMYGVQQYSLATRAVWYKRFGARIFRWLVRLKLVIFHSWICGSARPVELFQLRRT